MVPTVDLARWAGDPRAIALVPRALCEKYALVPVSVHEDSLVIAMADPSNRQAVDVVAKWAEMKVDVTIATAAAIAQAIDIYYAERPPG